MGAIFRLKSFYVFCFKNIKYQQLFVVQSIFQFKNSLEILHLFSLKFYNYLFEAALYKKDFLLIKYLSDKVELSLPKDFLIINQFHNQLLTNNLKSEDYFSWLAIISSHTTLQLIGLEKSYEHENHFEITSFLFNHPKIRKFFNNEKTKNLVLNNCHANAKKMFDLLFLELKISSKKALPEVMLSNKVIKI